MVGVRYHVQLSGSAQVRSNSRSPPNALFPVISNVQVTSTLIDGGAGLNILSVETFNNLQVPYD